MIGSSRIRAHIVPARPSSARIVQKFHPRRSPDGVSFLLLDVIRNGRTSRSVRPRGGRVITRPPVVSDLTPTVFVDNRPSVPIEN